MKKFDMEINSDSITESIKKDLLKRNSKLNKLIQIINVLDENRVLAINGRWGTGKTIFVKQLEYLNSNCNAIEYINENKINGFEVENLNAYRNKYLVHYYNAWENDLHESPLLSLIYSLINRFPSEKAQTASGKIQVPFNLKELLKTISANAIDLDKVESYDDITKEIQTIESRRESLNTLIDNVLPKEKRLLFIIDELDRCKPSFAVNLLEVLKHFFGNSKIVFIISTNNEQLSNVITKFYGNNFDGYGYLNKFYDLIIELNEINVEDYLQNVFNINKSSRYYDYGLFNACIYFKFSMREVNRLLSDYDLLNKYFNTVYSGSDEEDRIAKYIFLPYCLALKIESNLKLTKFLSGKGFEEFNDFVMSSSDLKKILRYEVKGTTSIAEEITAEKLKENLKAKYDIYFCNTSDDDSYRSNINRKKFIDTFSLIGNYTEVK